jgi:hypothetical protein
MEQRATGQFLGVQGPAGIVVSIAGWMLDPAICAGMTIGARASIWPHSSSWSGY